jgi:hypothetical protein
MQIPFIDWEQNVWSVQSETKLYEATSRWLLLAEQGPPSVTKPADTKPQAKMKASSKSIMIEKWEKAGATC